MQSWKTTVAGILGLVVVVANAVRFLIDGDPSTNPDWPTVWVAITAAVGLWHAKDKGTTGIQ